MHFSHDSITESAFVILDIRHYMTIRRKPGVETMNVIGSYKNWRNYHRTINELNALTTRELNDLGIARCDIPAVARGNR